MDKNLTKNIEKLINPITVGTLHFLQTFNDKLPKNIQKQLVHKSAKTNSLMGFVVEPYCYFLAYEIKHKNIFEQELPKNFILTKSKIFADEEEKFYCIIGCFSARTSAFIGNRIEIYVIAKDLNTNLTSWVIIDYDTNTISYDSKNGLSKPSVDNGIITTNYNGDVIVDMQRNDNTRKLVFNSNIQQAILKKLDPTLWIEGNLSVAYGKKLSDEGDVFSLRFDPKEMSYALEVDNNDLELICNTWYTKHLFKTPDKLICFPYAQHFLSDSPGHFSAIQNEKELIENINNINFSNINVYSTKNFEKIIMYVPITLITIILTLLTIIFVYKP